MKNVCTAPKAIVNTVSPAVNSSKARTFSRSTAVMVRRAMVTWQLSVSYIFIFIVSTAVDYPPYEI